MSPDGEGGCALPLVERFEPLESRSVIAAAVRKAYGLEKMQATIRQSRNGTNPEAFGWESVEARRRAVLIITLIFFALLMALIAFWISSVHDSGSNEQDTWPLPITPYVPNVR